MFYKSRESLIVELTNIARFAGSSLKTVKKGDMFCSMNGEGTYLNCSYVMGRHEIILGIYEDDELLTISFFHELGHIFHDSKFPASVDYNRYLIEEECWRVGRAMGLISVL